MALKPGGLGRGLDALLGDYSKPEENSIRTLSVNLIDINTDQPRKQFDEEKLQELSNSIKIHGIVQPIIVKKNGDRYTIVAGERRYRAARLAGLKEVPVILRDYADAEVMEVALIENLQRENLNPVEEATAIKFLMQQHDLTQEEVSDRISKSRPAVANTLRLLTLPEPVLDYLRSGELSAGHARALVALKDEDRIKQIADEAVKKGYSVRKIEELAKKQKEEKQPKSPVVKSAELSSAQETLQERLGTRVKIEGTEDRGRIVIEYFTKEDLNRLYEELMKEF